MNLSSALVLFIMSSDELAMWSFATQSGIAKTPGDLDPPGKEDVLEMSWKDLVFDYALSRALPSRADHRARSRAGNLQGSRVPDLHGLPPRRCRARRGEIVRVFGQDEWVLV